MPFIPHSDYNIAVPFMHKHKHVSTIYAGMFKNFSVPNYKRETLELSDGDFLMVDYNLENTQKAVILCHGLEGNSRRPYINSCATYFLARNYSVFAWNNRSCGGAMNRLPRLYHHAAIEDLDAVVQFALTKVEEVYLIGYSMGGAQVLNYFGRTQNMSSKVKAGIAVSVPVEVRSSAESLKQGFNKVYMNNFTSGLSKKLKIKAQQFPELLDWSKIKDIKTFDELDDNFTAPLHGFKDREDYYFSVSPARNIENISKPVLIINALDDPFLGDDCYPVDLATEHEYIHLETPKYGGHCAYPMKKTLHSYAEIRAFSFIEGLKR